jgi:hypothetical protein
MTAKNSDSLSSFKGDDELAFLAGIRLRELGFDFYACFLWSCGQCGCIDPLKVSGVIQVCLGGWSAAHEALTGEPHPFVDLILSSPYDERLPPSRLSPKPFTQITNEQRYTKP